MTPPAFLLRLMSHKNLSAGFRLGPEDREAYSFANDLRAATREGRLGAVWLHPANELAGQTIVRAGRHIASPRAALARALGLIAGASDYLFLWQSGSAVIEFKARDGRLSQSQRDFAAWCAEHHVPFHIARTSAEGQGILRELGILA